MNIPKTYTSEPLLWVASALAKARKSTSIGGRTWVQDWSTVQGITILIVFSELLLLPLQWLLLLDKDPGHAPFRQQLAPRLSCANKVRDYAHSQLELEKLNLGLER